MVETIYCVHCGAVAKHPVTKTIDGRMLNFCCGGCLQVYEILREEGLDSGPSKQETQTFSQPAGTMPSKTITIPIMGMTCANCVAHVEGSLRSVPGVLNANVNLATGHATVEMIPGVVTIADLKQAVEDAGYEVPDTEDA